ncbi:unnamed protein product [Closterium sp. Naga37s-1]|nr:unnamed protein product [Closterium sp. Naga37s-1]
MYNYVGTGRGAGGVGEEVLAELAASAGLGAARRGGGDSMSATALLLGPLLLPGGNVGGVAATAASSTAAVALPLLDLLQFFLWVAVSPAVAEELLFRGLLLMTLQEKLGRIDAAMLSAALFSLFHLSRTTLPPLFLSLLACLATTATVSGVYPDPYGIGESAAHKSHQPLPLAAHAALPPGLPRHNCHRLWHQSRPVFIKASMSLGSQHTTPSLSLLVSRLLWEWVRLSLRIDAAMLSAALFTLFHLSLPSLFKELLLTALMGAAMLSAAFFALFHLSLSLLFPNMALGIAAGLLAGANGQ